MLEVIINNEKKIAVSKNKKETYINQNLFDGEVTKLDDTAYKVFLKKRIFNVEVVDADHRQMELKINGSLISVSVTDHIDQILEKLGMNSASNSAIKEIKAPMPGSILNVLVSEGDNVASGDQLLVLEAMKMENVIKSSGEGTVSKVHVAEKENVEKNQVLISFE
ncbi:MAG: biotin/lipoyl-binding protein [Ekhidna sp.]|nr:biotin/lipoyl-binding protein [Ekhidna sp.]